MAKRFGRNQRRQLREEAAAASRSAAYWQEREGSTKSALVERHARELDNMRMQLSRREVDAHLYAGIMPVDGRAEVGVEASRHGEMRNAAVRVDRDAFAILRNDDQFRGLVLRIAEELAYHLREYRPGRGRR